MWTSLLFLGVSGLALCGAFRDPLPVGNASPRIVGGINTEVGEFPWQLSLENCILGIICSHSCGAVLLDRNTALTAAHCVDGQSTSNLRIIAGVTDRGSSNKQTIRVSSVVMHPQWDANGPGYPNDIAVLKLQSPADVDNNVGIEAIDMAPGGTFAGVKCTITGWGRTSGGGSLPNWLQKVDMTVLTNSDCKSRWQSVGGADINDGHICVFETGKSACNGDSGGPLVCPSPDGENKFVLAGITSWGISSCSGDYPSVYTRVTHFLEWIGGTTGN